MTRTEPQTPVDDSGDEKGGRAEVRTAWTIAPDDQETGNELQNQRLCTASKLAVRTAKSFTSEWMGIDEVGGLRVSETGYANVPILVPFASYPLFCMKEQMDDNS